MFFYLATQIELDRALELLITELEKNNILDDTVIVLLADHYPYGLEVDEINELLSHLEPRGILEVSRTGYVALEKGDSAII